MINKLNIKDRLKIFLAFFVVYNQVLIGANDTLNTYIKTISNAIEPNTLRSENIQSENIQSENIQYGGIGSDISPIFNALGDHIEPNENSVIFSMIEKSLKTAFNIFNIFNDFNFKLNEMSLSKLSFPINIPINIHTNTNYSKILSEKAVKLATTILLTILILSEEQIKNTPLDQISNVINQKINIYSQYLTTLLNSPEHINTIRNFSIVISQIALDIMKVIEPQLMEIIGKLEILLTNASRKMSDGIVRSGTSFIQTLWSTVPGLGAIIDAVITGGITANSITKVIRSSAEDSQAIISNINEVIHEIRELTDKKKSDISKSLSGFSIPVAVPIQPPLGFNQTVPSAPPAEDLYWDAPRPEPSAPPAEDLYSGTNFKGGSRSINKKRNYIKKKFIKTSKRIATTLRNFKKKNKKKTKRTKY